MTALVDTIEPGLDSVYVVRDKGTIIIDGGVPGKSSGFLPGLARLNVAPSDVKLIILTHGHWDHIGCVAVIKQTTGAPLCPRFALYRGSARKWDAAALGHRTLVAFI